MKPKLLIVELWGLGDLVIGSPFLRAAVEKYDVTLLAKPYAVQLQQRLWPSVRVVPFVAPWTAFKGKYRLWNWPVGSLLSQLWSLRRERFDFGVSARWDPRDHVLMMVAGVKTRLGYPRMGSQFFLDATLRRPAPLSHRYEYWRSLGDRLSLRLPPLGAIPLSQPARGNKILVHTGAGQPIRVWPLARFQKIITRLRAEGHAVIVACDADQRDAWIQAGETAVVSPTTVNGLIALIENSLVFVGNDSGPGHLAAFCGVPTFSIFGPQLPEWFAPLHPEGECVEGKPCPYKPCSDYCRFAEPVCLTRLTEDEVWTRLKKFLARHQTPVS
jgi:heptosyltransferase-2